MSKSNLALLDRAVQGAVALELGDGEHDTAVLAELGIAPQRTRTIAGLRVVSNAARDAEVDPKAAAMTDKLLRYRADRELVTSKLKRAGIEPLAVLPLIAWDRICDSTGLYRFSPNGDKVRIGGTQLANQVEKELVAVERVRVGKSAGKSMLVFGLIAVCSILLTIFTSSLWGWGIMVGVFGAFISLVVRSSDPAIGWASSTFKARLEELLAEHEKNGTLLKELWPKLVAPERGSEIRIELPTPPLEVQERLLAAERARFTLCVAVVGEAISFKESIADVLIRGKQEDLIERARLASLDRDPIAYVVEGSAVAIIDQYGDFPIELEVMNQVINSEHLV